MRIIGEVIAELTDEYLNFLDGSVVEKIGIQLENGVEKIFPVTDIVVDPKDKKVHISFIIAESQQKQDS